MTHPYWPLFDLRLTVGDVTLRPMTEADLIPLAAAVPVDLETDPALPRFGPDPSRHAAQSLFLSYWSYLGSWRTDNWRLPFTVIHAGTLVGSQDLEARDFATLRTVETASWLTSAYQGRGVGKAMRLAVLALAFDALDAEYAETEAWHDNAASLGVSRSLGYTGNGRTRHRRGATSDDMVRLRMTRQQWLSRRRDHAVTITGLASCRHMFGV